MRATAAPDTEWIEVQISDLDQMFNLMDPSPFHDRDLAPDAERFIVGWARELPPDAPLRLRVRLDRAPSAPADAEDLLRRAVDEHFRRRADSSRRELRQMLRIGRRSLIIGVLGLALSIVASELVSMWAGESRYRQLFADSLLIGGWVAMWRPLEIFLYDWWPIRADARLFDRLSAIPVTVVLRDR